MNNTWIIAKEGVRGVVISLVLFVILHWFGLESLAVLCLLFSVLWFFLFRNPERATPKDKEAIFSPCDGKILDIIYQDEKVFVDFEIALYDVGMIRAPYSTQNLKWQSYYGLALGLNSSELKERYNHRLYAQSDDFCLQIRSDFFAPLKYDVSQPQAGDRIGFCKAGRLRLQVKQDFSDLKINIGDCVKAGETILGYKNEH